MHVKPAVAECSLEKGEGAIDLYAPVFPYPLYTLIKKDRSPALLFESMSLQ